jgi:hypothetical protein
MLGARGRSRGKLRTDIRHDIVHSSHVLNHMNGLDSPCCLTGQTRYMSTPRGGQMSSIVTHATHSCCDICATNGGMFPQEMMFPPPSSRCDLNTCLYAPCASHHMVLRMALAPSEAASKCSSIPWRGSTSCTFLVSASWRAMLGHWAARELYLGARAFA